MNQGPKQTPHPRPLPFGRGEGEEERFGALRVASPPAPSPSDGEGVRRRTVHGTNARLEKVEALHEPGLQYGEKRPPFPGLSSRGGEGVRALSVIGRGLSPRPSPHRPASVGLRRGRKERDFPENILAL